MCGLVGPLPMDHCMAAHLGRILTHSSSGAMDEETLDITAAVGNDTGSASTTRRRGTLPKVLSCLGIVGLIYGFACFLLPAFAGSHLPLNFEWPIGYADNVQQDLAGNYYVRHDAASRLQVYDPQKQYLRGWYYDAGGGVSAIRLVTDKQGGEELEITTARANHVYRYSLDGKLLSNTTHSARDRAAYDRDAKSGADEYFPFHWWLIGLVSPAAGWAVGGVGMVLVAAGEGLRKLGKIRGSARLAAGKEHRPLDAAGFAQWSDRVRDALWSHADRLGGFVEETVAGATIIRKRVFALGTLGFFGIWLTGWTVGCVLMLVNLLGDGSGADKTPIAFMFPFFLGAEVVVLSLVYRNAIWRPQIRFTPETVRFRAYLLFLFTREVCLRRDETAAVALEPLSGRNMDKTSRLFVTTAEGNRYYLGQFEPASGKAVRELILRWAGRPTAADTSEDASDAASEQG